MRERRRRPGGPINKPFAGKHAREHVEGNMDASNVCLLLTCFLFINNLKKNASKWMEKKKSRAIYIKSVNVTRWAGR